MKRTYQAGGVVFPNKPVMIGAGVCKNPERTLRWLKEAPVVTGSYTKEARLGNSGERLFYPDTLTEFLSLGYGLNSFGVANGGVVAANEAFKKTRSDNPLILSIAGFSIEDYISSVEVASENDAVAAVELNLSCPNMDHGKIFSFDSELLTELFNKLAGYNKKPLWVKFSPYADPNQLKGVAALVNKYRDNIKAVVTCNTFPNGYAGVSAVSPNGGLSGLSGPALKPIALGQVRQFRQLLDSKIDIIGVGGITTGNDVVDFLDAGASATQLTSLPFWLGQPGEFWQHLLNPETGNRLHHLL